MRTGLGLFAIRMGAVMIAIADLIGFLAIAAALIWWGFPPLGKLIAETVLESDPEARAALVANVDALPDAVLLGSVEISPLFLLIGGVGLVLIQFIVRAYLARRIDAINGEDSFWKQHKDR